VQIVQRGKRWTVPVTAVLAFMEMAPLVPQDLQALRAVGSRMRDALLRAADDIDRGASFEWAREQHRLAAFQPPDGSALPFRFSSGRMRWTAGRVSRKLRRRHGQAPSRHTLLRALEALRLARAIHRLEDGRRYVFVGIPSGPDLLEAFIKLGAIRLGTDGKIVSVSGLSRPPDGAGKSAVSRALRSVARIGLEPPSHERREPSPPT